MPPSNKASRTLTGSVCTERPWRAWASGVLLTGGVGVCAWVLARLLISETLRFNANPVAIGAIVLVNVAAVVLTFVLWRTLVQTTTGVHVSISSGLIGQAALMIGKYVPGKIAGVAGRFLSLGQAIEAGKAFVLVLIEQIYILVGLGIVGFTLAGALLGYSEMLAIAVVSACIGAFGPRFIVGVSNFASSRIPPFVHIKDVARTLGLQHSLWLSILALMVALCVTASAWFTPDIIGFTASSMLRWQLVGAYALSVLSGMAVFILPGGIGAREGAFVALAQSIVGSDAAIACAALLRVVNVIVDLGMGMAGILLSRWMRGRHESR